MKGWKKGNTLDVGALLLALLCVVSGGFRLWERKQADDDVELLAYTVTFLAEEIPAERSFCLAVGEVLYSETGDPLGTVTEILRTPAVFHLLSNGVYYEGAHDLSRVCDMTLQAKLQGHWDAGGAVCGSLRLVPGGTVRIRSLRGDWELWILSVTEILK